MKSVRNIKKKGINDLPLVSIICVSYNHARFIEEALDSVLCQNYKNIELIIVDDASTDSSPEIISVFSKQYPFIKIVLLDKNMGHCAAFNQGLQLARGSYIVDLAGDDVLLPNRIGLQVAAFEELDSSYAVVFTDTYIINEEGKVLGTFYSRDRKGKLTEDVPSGYIYSYLIRKMVISSPTMMMRKSVLDELGGYDENLSYEDYDFWVRSGRRYSYYYIDKILAKKRKVRGSQGSQFYKAQQNKHLESTLKVCYKAQKLNENKDEDLALAVSVSYHLQLAYLTNNHDLCRKYYKLLKTLKSPSLKDRIFILLAIKGVNVHALYRFFLKNFRKIG